MILHMGERVYWGAPEVMYLEGVITRLDDEKQAVLVHIDRATPNSAHLIDTDVAFSADGLAPMQGNSPEGTTAERNTQHSAVGQTVIHQLSSKVSIYQSQRPRRPDGRRHP